MTNLSNAEFLTSMMVRWLLSQKYQSLPVNGDSFCVLDLELEIFNKLSRLYFYREGLSGQGFDVDLHAALKFQD